MTRAQSPDAYIARLEKKRSEVTRQIEAPGLQPEEAEAIVAAVESGIRRAAERAWARHPNNPANKKS